MKYFITSDVHGHYTILKKCLKDKGWEDDNPSHILIICGDVFDRGDETIELYEWLKSLEDRFIYIKGNHEYLLLSLYKQLHYTNIIDVSPAHYHNGTIKTLNAFSPLLLESFFGYPMDEHWDNKKLKSFIRWVTDKPIDYYEIDDKLFVHGWFPKDYKNNTSEEDWERASWVNGMCEWFNGNRINGKTVYCGHWSTYYGHFYIHQKCNLHYIPFKDEGIVGLDSTVVASGFLNIEVLEV